MGRTPEAGWRQDGRATVGGGGGQRLVVGGRSSTREEVRRVVWGEVR
jgi:hypothetical protein